MDLSPPASSEMRPPTPPRERAVEKTLGTFTLSSKPADATALAELDTPPPSSSPLQSSPAPHSLLKAGVKKIRFVAQPSLIDTPDVDVHALHQAAPLRPLPPSRHQRSYRSILKAHGTSSPLPSSDDAESSLGNASISDFDSFTDMLEAVVKGLSSTTYASRIDAYQLLLKCFRAYRKVPDPQAFIAQLPFFQDVLRRDMLAISSATQGPDAKLIGQASRVIANLMWDSKISASLSQDFIDAVMTQCIAVAEAPKLPKEVVKNQLFLLTIDRFLARACSPSKAASIVSAFATVQDRVSGDHIQAIRLLTLQQLLRCAPATLVAQAADWLPWIFHGIMSPSVEIRAVAITTGAVCSTSLGSNRHVSVAVKEHFEQQSLGQGCNFDHFYRRIEDMIQDVDDARRVPGIWSIVILLLRGGQQTLASWSRLNQWFKIIQTCLNKSDSTLNLEAWVAWNNLIFAVHPSLSTPSFLRKILIKPIIAKLQLHAKTESARRIREAAFSSFSLLLYYAFRPGCSADHISLYWADFVMEVVQNARMTSRRDFDRLCDILTAVLSNPDSGVWDADRYAPSCTNPVKAVEIPRIDPAWTRANIDVATELVEHLVSMQLPLHGQHDFAQRIWRSLLKAVTEAGSREVKSSPALKRAVAEVLNLFARLTERITIGNIRTASPDSALDCICDMADAIRCLQPSNFTDKCVTSSESGTYGVPQTPLKAGLDHGLLLQTPLIALLQMINPLVKAATPHSDGLEALDTLVSACVNSLSTRKAKLQFLKSCAKAVCGGPEPSSRQPSQTSLWNCIATSVMSVLTVEGPPVSLQNNGQQLHQDYQACLVVAKKGLDLTSSNDCRTLMGFISVLINTAEREAGDAAALISVVAPLSLAIICCHPRDGLNAPLAAATAMLETQLSPPSDRSLRSAAKFMLPQGESLTNWSFALFNMTNRLLHEASKGSDMQTTHLDDFFTVLSNFSKSSLCDEPKELLIQCHIGLSQCAKHASLLPSNFASLWTSFMDILARCITKDSRNLAMHEMLFVAGFTSDRRTIARITIDYWNSTFGSQDDIIYSVALTAHLEQLSGIAHILRNAAEVQDQRAVDSEALINFDTTYPWTTQAAETDPVPTIVGFHSTVPSLRPERLQQTVLSHKLSAPSPAKMSKKVAATKPAKLRHDDSQIDFVPVISSPVQAEVEESQHLTEHQKDVRSRQDLDGALYAELRSNSVSASKDSSRGIVAMDTSLLPARILTFGEQSQDVTPDVHAIDRELHMSTSDDIYEIPLSPSQQRSKRRVEQKGMNASTRQAPGDSDLRLPNQPGWTIGTLGEGAQHTNAVDRSNEETSLNTTSSHRTTIDDEAARPADQTAADNNVQAVAMRRSEPNSAEANDSVVAVQDSFPILIKPGIRRVDDSFVDPIASAVKSKRALRMTLERTNRMESPDASLPVDGTTFKRRKLSATQEPQRRKKEETPQRDVDTNNFAATSFPSDDEIEVTADQPVQQPRGPPKKAASRRGRPPKAETKPAVDESGPRRSDRRRRRSQNASSEDEETVERASKVKRTVESASPARDSQRRKSLRQAGEKASCTEAVSTTGANSDKISGRDRRASGRAKQQGIEQTVEQNAQDEDEEHQVKSEAEPEPSAVRAEASLVEIVDASPELYEYGDEQDMRDPAASDWIDDDANAIESTDSAAEVPAGSVEAELPTRPTFSPTMSEKAQTFINRMRDMYRQCKELVLGAEDQTIMDEMEDVHEMLGKEITRVGRRGKRVVGVAGSV